MRPAIENPFERVVVTELQIKLEKRGVVVRFKTSKKKEFLGIEVREGY